MMYSCLWQQQRFFVTTFTNKTMRFTRYAKVGLGCKAVYDWGQRPPSTPPAAPSGAAPHYPQCWGQI